MNKSTRNHLQELADHIRWGKTGHGLHTNRLRPYTADECADLIDQAAVNTPDPESGHTGSR